MKQTIENNVGYLVAGSMLLGSFLLSGTALAAGPTTGGWQHRAPGVFGTVSAISGDTITVTSKGFGQNATPATYAVDATNATVTKAGASSSVSSIAIGDMVMVQGTVSGTNVTAASIRDGVGARGQGQKTHQGSAPVIQGNGQPVIGGNVTAVNGSVLTVTNKSNVTYSIDATNATVEKGNATSSVSAIAIGDNVVVQGTVNGASVTASSVMDSGANTASAGTTSGAHKGGFFGGIGNFFHSLFGFF